MTQGFRRERAGVGMARGGFVDGVVAGTLGRDRGGRVHAVGVGGNCRLLVQMERRWMTKVPG